MTNQQIQLFTSTDGQAQLEVALEQDTVWLSQAQMAELFATSADNISLHLRNIYREGELEEAATTEDFSVVHKEGSRQVRRWLRHYNLDTIVSMVYCVSSARATQFRIWATRVVLQYLVDGYTLTNQQLVSDEGRSVLQVIGGYARFVCRKTVLRERLLAALACINLQKPASIETSYVRRFFLSSTE